MVRFTAARRAFALVSLMTGAAVFAIALLGAPAATALPIAPPTAAVRRNAPVVAPRLRVDFLAVGHGDAIFVTSPVGKTVLIDGGLAEAGPSVAEAVRARTAAPIDLVMLTHRHADHLGGLATVIDRQGARLFMDAAFPHPSPAYQALLTLLDDRRVPMRQAVRGRAIDLGGGVRMVLLTPPEPLITGSRSDVNANSLVVRLEHGRVRILLTGDAEAATEAWLLATGADVRADVLKLAHHGGRHSSTMRFLRAVAPRVAIASSGPERDSGGGYLHPETRERVATVGARLLRTDLDGTITIWSDGQDVTVETHHAMAGRP